MIRLSVIVATYGLLELWEPKAMNAMLSVDQRPDVEVIRRHGKTRASSRNMGAAAAKGSRLVFLDADDELASGFSNLVIESEDILQPKTIYRDASGETEPFWIEPREDFLLGNHIVIGAPVNRELFMDSGGFEEYQIAEDWALWLKLQKMGASFGRTEATYIVNVNHNGVNSQPDSGVYDQIRKRFA